MLGALLVVAALAAGPTRIRVEVLEYGTRKTVPGAQVTLRARSGAPAEVRGTTDAAGRALVEAPHLDFDAVEITKDGYVPRAELNPLRSALEPLETRTPRGSEEVLLEVLVVPRSWWTQNMKAVTREQAVERANFWSIECGPGSTPTSVTFDEKRVEWSVIYSCLQVVVSPKSGEARVRGVPERVTSTPLYPAEDAIADALSSPLELFRVEPEKLRPGDMPECAYRNQKVLVINVYCTKKEIHTTGIEIIHPDRGLIYFYAEASEPISTITREDYQQWSIDVRDPHPGARVSMTYEELQAWKSRRRRLNDQLCWAGFGSPGGVPVGCTRKTPEIRQWWEAEQKRLLKTPPESWYRLVKAMRALIAKPGRPGARGSESVAATPAPGLTSGTTPVGTGPVRIIVEVRETGSNRIVVGARVAVRDANGSGELVAMTGPKGKALFNAPNASYAPAGIDKEGMIPDAELKPMWELLKKSISVRRYPHGDDEVAYEATVVPRAWLEAKMKVRTPEQAIAIAADWGVSCGPGGPPRVELFNTQWKVTYPCLTVHINPWDGNANGPSAKPHEVTATPPYPLEEALADALSAPLTHVGNGVLPDRYSIPSCVYRNDKVFVINSYCTIKEINPSGLMVLHPTRGVVSFRAQGIRDQKVSTVPRDQYEDWAFGTADAYPGLDLKMGVKELFAWEANRHRLFSTPGCSAALMSARGKKESGCHAKTPDAQAWWDRVWPAWLEAPPESWYRLVKELRRRASKDAKPDPRYATGE